MGLRAGSLSVAAAGLAAVGCAAQPALAVSHPAGRLTGNEYTLLSAARLGLASALSERQSNWVTAAQNACLTVTLRRSTPLLASQKANCLGSLGLRVTLATFRSANDRCERRGPKRAILCRAPLYEGLARDAASAYTAEVKAQQAIVERGFTRPCATVLGSTPTQLGHAHKLVASTQKLSADWQLLVGIVEGRTPRTRLKQNQIERDTRVVTNDIRLAFRANPHVDLSICPHQQA